MRSLVWTFWLALFSSIVITFLLSVIMLKQWHSFSSYSQLEQNPSYPLQTLSVEIQTALNENKSVDKLLQESPVNKFGNVYLINSLGEDILNRSLTKDILMFLDNQTNLERPIFTRTIKSSLGEQFTLIFYLDSPTPIWELFKRFGLFLVLSAAVFVSVVISWWLASKIVRPIRDIALASSLNEGQEFLNKIDKKILKRSDEIGVLARQLQTSGTKLQNLVYKQKDFLRDVSHEVRSPLARLQLAAETLELDRGDKDALAQIKNEILIIDQLVQDLLHLSHFDRPSHDHNIESISIYKLINECIKRSNILSNEKNILITVGSKMLHDINIMGNKFLLERALDNLISNAIRHSPINGNIEVKYEINEDHLCFSVSDQGKGVNDDNLKDIFEPFFRTDSSRSRQTGGFGLGLSLVKRIIEMHKGSVTALNQAGGFMVKILLPR